MKNVNPFYNGLKSILKQVLKQILKQEHFLFLFTFILFQHRITDYSNCQCVGAAICVQPDADKFSEMCMPVLLSTQLNSLSNTDSPPLTRFSNNTVF